ncbi:hypothetical protein IGI37_002785 [Enterococcus sp. AZ194]|uniref:MFS transporter n=1 Tax=Enterococcus sp. AZ194 TaxID=2774629 RepID=UPI003F212A3D
MKNNQAYIKLIVGQVLANIGDTIYTVAIVSSVFALTNSALAASMVPVIITGGMVVSGLLAPVITARFSITSIIKISQSCKLFILFLLAVYLQSRINQPNITLIYLLVAGIAFFDGFTESISMALVPHYVEKEYLIKANSLFSTLLQLVGIGSWAIGSSLLILFSVAQVVWLDVGVYVLSTISLLLLPKVKIDSDLKQTSKEELLSGWKGIKKYEVIQTVIKMDLLETIANTIWASSIVLVFVKEVLHVSESWWGYINATFFVGAMMGSLIVMRVSEWIDHHKSSSIYWGSFLGAIVTIIVSLSWNPIFVLICSVLIGLFSQIKNIPQATSIQQNIPKDQLASIYASTGVLNTAAFSISILLMGIISDVFGVRTAFFISGLLLLIVARITRKKKHLFDEKRSV